MNQYEKKTERLTLKCPCFFLNQQDDDRRENDAELETSPGAGGGAPTCRRHKLQVNFADIGWSHWIISPQTFEAHYCAGSCPYPLTKVCSTPCEGVSQYDTAFAL
jgi:hypothetical protein